MRTTIEINDQLYRAARKQAAEEGVPLREIVERGLRVLLTAQKRGDTRYSLRWRAERGEARPGVDLADRKALFDLMEERR